MRKLSCGVAIVLLGPVGLWAQRPAIGSDARQYVVIDAPVTALTNVTIIDGTGAPPKTGQTIVLFLRLGAKVNWHRLFHDTIKDFDEKALVRHQSSALKKAGLAH